MPTTEAYRPDWRGRCPDAPEHLDAYQIARKAKLVSRTKLRVVDQFEALGVRLDVKKPSLPLVPSLKAPGAPPSQTPANHARCAENRGGKLRRTARCFQNAGPCGETQLGNVRRLRAELGS